jgi:hypothetical protein
MDDCTQSDPPESSVEPEAAPLIDVDRLKTDFAYFCEVVGVDGPWRLNKAQRALLAAMASSEKPQFAVVRATGRRAMLEALARCRA